MYLFNRKWLQKILSVLLLVILITGLFFSSPTQRSSAQSAGYALSFDGVNDYVSFGYTVDMLGPNWMNVKTVSLWIKPAQAGRLCAHQEPGWCDHIFGDRPRWWGIAQGVLGGQDRIWVWNFHNVATTNRVGVTYTPGEWMYLTMVHNYNTLTVYKNGELVGSIATGLTMQPANGARPVIHIGAVINTTTRVWPFAGEIDEMSMWSAALTQEQVRQNMYAVLAGNEPDLRAYYRMTEGAGLTVTDDSQFNWTGTLKDGGGIVPPNGAPPLWVPSTAFDASGVATPTSPAAPTETPIPVETTPVTPATPTFTPVPPTLTATPTVPLPSGITEVGVYLTPGDAWDVVVSGNYAYIADVDAGLRVVDVSNPANPVEVGAYDTPGRAYELAVLGSYAYIADGRSGFAIIDISNPAAPTLVSAIKTKDNSWGIATDGTNLYLADRWGGIGIFDVSNPAQPVERAWITTPDQTMDVVLDGNRLYVAANNAGLLAYDVSNPASPVSLWSYNSPGASFGVEVVGGRVALADGYSGVFLFDPANPSAPIAAVNTPGLSRDVTMDGNRVFVADETGLRVYDFTNLASPVQLAFIDTPGHSRGVDYQNGFAYVSDFAGGLRVISAP